MDDLKEILTFKGGFFLGVIMWILFLMLFMLIGMLFMLPFQLAADKKEMEEQHCTRTEETKTYLQSGTMLVGKVIIPTQHTVTENKYVCDDHERWR